MVPQNPKYGVSLNIISSRIYLLTRLTTADAIQAALREIDLKLQLHGKSNRQVNLPNVIHTQTEFERMRDSFNSQECITYADLHEPRLTSEQRHVYVSVLEAIRGGNGRPFMIDAPAGTGKTYTEKCIASRLRGEKCSNCCIHRYCCLAASGWLDCSFK